MAAITVAKITFQFPGMVYINNIERKPDINATKANLTFLSCMHKRARNIPGRAKSNPRALVSGIRLPKVAPIMVLITQLE